MKFNRGHLAYDGIYADVNTCNKFILFKLFTDLYNINCPIGSHVHETQ